MQWYEPARTALNCRNTKRACNGIEMFVSQPESFAQAETCADE